MAHSMAPNSVPVIYNNLPPRAVHGNVGLVEVPYLPVVEVELPYQFGEVGKPRCQLLSCDLSFLLFTTIMKGGE